jgi:hypothetical protein
LLQAHSYAKVPNPPSLTGGAPGLIETSVLGSVGLVRLFGADKADTVLPPGRRRQTYLRFGRSTHVVRELGRNHTRLCPSANFVVGDPAKIDLTANAKIQGFLGKLPGEPYPFPIDEAARRRGKQLTKPIAPVVMPCPPEGRGTTWYST